MDMEQGKVIILGGTPRAGKTTLAVELARHGFSRISFDHLSDAIRRGFPEVIIREWTSQEECAQRMYGFFESIVESAVDDAQIYGLNTVIDMYDYTPEYVSRLPCQEGIEVYFLAYPGLSVEQIRHNIRFYAQPTDWIAQVDEEYLQVVAQRCNHVNEKLVKQCGEYGYEIINTGAGDERGRALQKLFDKITR